MHACDLQTLLAAGVVSLSMYTRFASSLQITKALRHAQHAVPAWLHHKASGNTQNHAVFLYKIVRAVAKSTVEKDYMCNIRGRLYCSQLNS